MKTLLRFVVPLVLYLASSPVWQFSGVFSMPPPSGGDDCAIANAAYLTYSQVEWGAYNYSCRSTITNLKMGMAMVGSSVGTTSIEQDFDGTMLVISDGVKFSPASPNVFLLIRDILFKGEKTAYPNPKDDCVDVLYPIQDLHIEHVFLDNCAGYGLHAVGGWGYNYDDLIVEYNGYGIWESDEGIYSYDGAVSGTPDASGNILESGNTVTQDNTGAKGIVIDDPVAPGGTVVKVETLSGSFSNHDIIQQDLNPSTNYFSPTTRWQYYSSGPKITESKIKHNGTGAGAYQLYLGLGMNDSLISNSEFDSYAGAAAGQTACGEILNGALGTIFDGDRFDAVTAPSAGPSPGTNCYILNGQTQISNGTHIENSIFYLASDSEHAIINNAGVGGFVVTGDSFRFSYANPTANPIVVNGPYQGVIGTNLYYGVDGSDIGYLFGH